MRLTTTSINEDGTITETVTHQAIERASDLYREDVSLSDIFSGISLNRLEQEIINMPEHAIYVADSEAAMRISNGFRISPRVLNAKDELGTGSALDFLGILEENYIDQGRLIASLEYHLPEYLYYIGRKRLENTVLSDERVIRFIVNTLMSSEFYHVKLSCIRCLLLISEVKFGRRSLKRGSGEILKYLRFCVSNIKDIVKSAAKKAGKTFRRFIDRLSPEFLSDNPEIASAYHSDFSYAVLE